MSIPFALKAQTGVAFVADSTAEYLPPSGWCSDGAIRLPPFAQPTPDRITDRAQSARAAKSTTHCTVDTIGDYASFVALESMWNKLVDEAQIDYPFVRHEWLRTWWDCFGEGHKLNILLVRNKGAPIGIVPLMLCERRLCGVPVRQLQFMWNVYAERFDVVVGESRELAYRAMLEHLLQCRHWDVLVMPQVPAGSPSLTELPRLAAENRMRIGLQASCESPYVPLATSWQAYCDGLDRKHRSNLRNREKRLSQLGSLGLEIVSSTNGLPAALRDGFSLEAAGWKGEAGTAISTDPRTLRFYTGLAQKAAERGSLRLCFLTLDGARIAFGYYLEYGNKLYLLKPGYDPKFATYSPSQLLCYYVIRDAFQRGIAEVDFLASPDPWKCRWTNELRSHHWLYMFPDRMESRLLHWTKFQLMPRLGEQPMLRMLRDAAVDALHATSRSIAHLPVAGKADHNSPSFFGRLQSFWPTSAPMEIREL